MTRSRRASATTCCPSTSALRPRPGSVSSAGSLARSSVCAINHHHPIQNKQLFVCQGIVRGPRVSSPLSGGCASVACCCASVFLVYGKVGGPCSSRDECDAKIDNNVVDEHDGRRPFCSQCPLPYHTHTRPHILPQGTACLLESRFPCLLITLQSHAHSFSTRPHTPPSPHTLLVFCCPWSRAPHPPTHSPPLAYFHHGRTQLPYASDIAAVHFDRR